MKKQSDYTMKKASNFCLSLLALAGLIFVTSCGEDEETPLPGPSIVLTPNDTENQESFSGFVGEEVTINVSVDASEGFNVLRVYRKIDGVNGDPLEEFQRDPGTTQTEFATDFTYTILEDDVDNTIFLVFEAVDDQGNTAEIQYEIIAEEKPTRKYEAKLLLAPTSDEKSETFFSTNDGETYSVSEVLGTDASISPKIDFGYFYGTEFNATIASPAAYPINYAQDGWDKRNATKIKRTDISASGYIEIQNSEELINKAYEEAEFGNNEGLVKNLVVGDILAFELVSDKGNKRGLIKVNDIVGTMEAGDYIEIEVVVVD